MRWIERESYRYPRWDPKRGYPRRTIYWTTAKDRLRRGWLLRVFRLTIRGFSLRGEAWWAERGWGDCRTLECEWMGLASEGLVGMTPIDGREAERIIRRGTTKSIHLVTVFQKFPAIRRRQCPPRTSDSLRSQ